MNVGDIRVRGRSGDPLQGYLPVLRFFKPEPQQQPAVIPAFSDGDIFIRALHDIFAVQRQNPAAPGAGGLQRRVAVQGRPGRRKMLRRRPLPGFPGLVNQVLRRQRVLQGLLGIRQGLENQRRIPGVVPGVVEGHLLVRLDVHLLHGLLQAGPVLQLVLLGKQLLNIAHGRQRDVPAFKKVDVLLQHAHVVASPGQQRVVLSAPGGKLLQRLPEGRRPGQLLRPQPGHPPDPGMNLNIMGRGDGQGDGIGNRKILPQLHRADLDHLKDQLVPDFPVNRALPGDGLIPLQVQNNIVHGKFIAPVDVYSPPFPAGQRPGASAA